MEGTCAGHNSLRSFPGSPPGGCHKHNVSRSARSLAEALVRRATKLILTSCQTGETGPNTAPGSAVVCAPADGNAYPDNLHNQRDTAYAINTTPTRRLYVQYEASHLIWYLRNSCADPNAILCK
jgi:hypothetical protein